MYDSDENVAVWGKKHVKNTNNLFHEMKQTLKPDHQILPRIVSKGREEDAVCGGISTEI